VRQTYETAIAQVFKDEGGYTNEATDPGGPTNWGITIYDARKYWKSDAQAEDIKNMPKSVAEDIYRKHYADPISYDLLPAGVDYSVLDFGINSGISKSVKTLQRIVDAPPDGIMGPNTIMAVAKKSPQTIVEEIWDTRLAYDKSLTHLWPIYGKGWTNRINRGRALALSLTQTQTQIKETKMNPILSLLLTLVGPTQIGGWVRAGAASGLTFLAAHFGLSFLGDPALGNAVGAALSTILVGLWSSLGKTGMQTQAKDVIKSIEDQIKDPTIPASALAHQANNAS
jgi:lysozyme family protein